ncbi:MAG TPA: hypothetical protein VKV17_05310 [Bryobacteraceae bacterium]|nr:hypothetical protein [Bryobacteraceae bacterium]
MKWLLIFGAQVSLLLAADPREIVRKAVELSERDTQLANEYNYLQHQETRELDRSGNARVRKDETWDIIPLEGSPYKRLVSRDGHNLSAAEQQVEQQKLEAAAEERSKETAGQRERRLEEWRHRQDRQRQPLRELPDAFNFTLLSEQNLDGRPVYLIEAVPKPDYKPKSTYTSFFPKVKIRAWIDRADLEAVRIEIEPTDTISFGGFLLRLDKGSRIVIEQTRMDDQLWLPRRVSVLVEGRIMLLKNLSREMDYNFTDYKKFQVDSRVVYLSPAGR